MENLEKFVRDKLAEIGKRRYIIDDDKLEFDIETMISTLKNVEVYRLTQKEIDEHLEDYPEYYEDLKEGDIVYSDGEVAWEIEALEIWISEIQSSWKEHYHTQGDDSDVRYYITYRYAQELAEKLEQETK